MSVVDFAHGHVARRGPHGSLPEHRRGQARKDQDADRLLGQTRQGQPGGEAERGLFAVHRGMDASIDDGLAIEEAAFARIVPTHDAQEGVAASVEKRPPTFLGR